MINRYKGANIPIGKINVVPRKDIESFRKIKHIKIKTKKDDFLHFDSELTNNEKKNEQFQLKDLSSRKIVTFEQETNKNKINKDYFDIINELPLSNEGKKGGEFETKTNENENDQDFLVFRNDSDEEDPNNGLKNGEIIDIKNKDQNHGI